MMFWADIFLACSGLVILFSMSAQYCNGKSYYTSNNGHLNVFTDHLKKDDYSHNTGQGKVAETAGAMLDALLQRMGQNNKDITMTRMMYENMAETNAVHQSDRRYQDFLKSNELPTVQQEPPYWAAPKYMIELYNKFETDRYSHPLANIVRSFVNIYEDPTIKSRNNRSKTEMRRHVMKFNISSVSRDEEIHLAELRLYTLVEADRKTYFGNDRRVSIYEVLDDEDIVDNNMLNYDLVASKDNVYGRHNGWETFTITDSVKKWVRNDVEMKTLEVRIETIKTRYLSPDIDIDIDTNPHQENEPLLVVFSNDKKKRKSEQRELHEMFMHYANDIQEDIPEGEDYEDDYEYFDDQEENVYKRDTETVLKKFYKSTSMTQNILGVIKNDTVSGATKFKEGDTSNVNMDTKRQALSRKVAKREMLKKLYKQILEMTEEEENMGDRNVTLSRVKRSKAKKKKARRSNCRRKPLQVKFRDIDWDSWIIAPQSYDAYECTGRCYFPMNDHLTPTKHAIIQTLLHTNHPNKANRACCVPTKLDPISILYVDEKGVVTYKYKYEGMVVAQCGCR